MSEAELEAALFPTDPKPPRAPAHYLPDFSHIHKELQEHKHVTLQLLWEEYTATHPDGYRYSQFCYHYQQWKRQRDVVMRQQHRPGEKLFVGWAGDKISVHEPDRGGVLQASLFVAVLGASSYTYAEATEDETMPSWIGAHVRAFEFMGGVAELLIPDNTKTGVSKACRYEPDLNPTYQEMAMHYGLAGKHRVVIPQQLRSSASARPVLHTAPEIWIRKQIDHQPQLRLMCRRIFEIKLCAAGLVKPRQ
jgi:transposase